MNTPTLMEESPWNEEQLEALWGSAEKWLNIFERKEGDFGGFNCPCCVKFFFNEHNTKTC